jgi:hypothetical protein
MLSEKIIGVWELQIWETVVDDKLSATRWGKRHPVSLPIIQLALCRSIFPHGTVLASQLMIPLQATQSS